MKEEVHEENGVGSVVSPCCWMHCAHGTAQPFYKCGGGAKERRPVTAAGWLPTELLCPARRTLPRRAKMGGVCQEGDIAGSRRACCVKLPG